ncbi:MAG: hypothetical protein L6R35_001038 [Caloplaca aegaea]|nr:MAG: hypothetical protein L6R35_001038 [Caloplaca aegaea]
MAASWKQNPSAATSATRKVSLTHARKFFAVDASGSTAGRIIQLEGQFVEQFNTHPQDQVSKWGSSCSAPLDVSSACARSRGEVAGLYWNPDQGGTYPEKIIQCSFAKEAILQSDVWFLMTDGEVRARDVQELASAASRESITNVPVCLVIFGTKQKLPVSVNISVGIPVYATATEALLLFKDTHSGKLYIVAAKGGFSPLAKFSDHIDLSDWENLASFDNENALIEECERLHIEIINSADRHDTPAVSLGQAWDSSTGVLVDIDSLLRQTTIDSNDMNYILQEEAFEQLALVCKTRHRLRDLRSFLTRHKQDEVIVRLEDTHGAGHLLQRLRSPDLSENEREDLSAQLRKAHLANREAYLKEKHSPREQVRATKRFNLALDHAMALLAALEKASYTANILSRKSNRARRAEAVSAGSSDVHLSGLDLSDDVQAFRGTCNICCGEDEIMSIVLKKLDNVEENTSDFFLNFPLVAAQQNADLISSQCICFQCATLVGLKSVLKEDLSAILPAVSYAGENKGYINHQLTIAVTAGLATGAAGMLQMFMSIMDHTLQTKQWCSSQSDIQRSDPEISNRRQTLEWILNDLLRTCITRERFSDETSSWVQYPVALRWAIDDWEKQSLDSWIVQYPLKGFNQLMRWYSRLDPTLASSTRMDQVKVTKLLNVVISKFMARLLYDRHGRAWVHAFMQLIYREFNATNVPRALDDQSVIASTHFWPKLEELLKDREDEKQFLDSIPSACRPAACRRVQVIVFWAIFTQNEHATATGFFHKLRLREALAPPLLDSMEQLPDESMLQKILRSIFLEDRKPTDIAHDDVPPFVTPFGPRIISCGMKFCGTLFYDPNVPDTLHPDLVRKRRAEHFNRVFQHGTGTETGLPEPVNAPERPSSEHYTLHMSIVKVWTTLQHSLEATHTAGPDQVGGRTVTSKLDVINAKEQATRDFVVQARKHICLESHRGNIYQHGLDDEIRELLPSFFEALRVASERDGLDDKSGLSYVHDWTKNKLAEKIAYEMSLKETR